MLGPAAGGRQPYPGTGKDSTGGASRGEQVQVIGGVGASAITETM
jgi:hypothetical protein